MTGRTSRCACGASPQRSANVACALQGKHGAGQPSAYHLGVPSTFTLWEVCWNCSAWALRARRLTSEVSAMSSNRAANKPILYSLEPKRTVFCCVAVSTAAARHAATCRRHDGFLVSQGVRPGSPPLGERGGRFEAHGPGVPPGAASEAEGLLCSVPLCSAREARGRRRRRRRARRCYADRLSRDPVLPVQGLKRWSWADRVWWWRRCAGACEVCGW